MDLNEYQVKAGFTDTTADKPQHRRILPLLGLAGEAATLLTAYKKHLRDGAAYLLYKDEVGEELGDVLWYLATVASHYGLQLNDIAQQNLDKARDRFTPQVTINNLDENFPPQQRFPRQIEFVFIEHEGRVRVFRAVDGKQFGDPLTDNAYDDDGYRYHDALHMAFVAVLGWSPVVRGLLGAKRRKPKIVDDVEDGGRAIVIDEGIAAFIFEYARAHNMLRDADTIDFSVLRTIGMLASRLEVSVRTPHDWEQAILQGFAVFRELHKHKGGRVRLDLDARTIKYATF